jgi:hypothetical protein
MKRALFIFILINILKNTIHYVIDSLKYEFDTILLLHLSII